MCPQMEDCFPEEQYLIEQKRENILMTVLTVVYPK